MPDPEDPNTDGRKQSSLLEYLRSAEPIDEELDFGVDPPAEPFEL